MIMIPLSVNSPLSDTVSFHFSPLYELAASLHVLAQPVPPRRFLTWTEEVHRLFDESLLYTDWVYFRPLFHSGIPHVMDPVQTKGVVSIEEQYDYFLSLSTTEFAGSVQPLLNRCMSNKIGEPVAVELREDPEYVKGRFTLFLSTYRQLYFEAQWEKLAPLFVREGVRIKDATQQLDSLLAYLQQIWAAISFDERANLLTCRIPGPLRGAEQLLICPSYYHFSPPSLEQTGKLVHLLYTIPQR